QRLEAVRERVTEGEGVLAERRIQLETATAESEDSAGRLSALRGESLQVRSAISNTESELATLSERQAELRGLIRTLNALEEQMEGLPEGERSVLKSHGESRKAGVIGVVADYLEVPQVYEKAVMAVLGERLGHVIVDEPESGRSAVDYLKERAVGRGSFIHKTPRSNGHRDDNGSLKRAKGKGIHGPLADLVGFSAQLNGVGDFLLGGTLLVEDLDLAVRLWKENGLTATLVTLDGDVVEPTGVITGGNQDTEETLLARKRKIREVSKELGQVEARFEKTRSQRETLKEKADGLEAELAELEVTGRDKEKVRFALESSVSLADRELGQLRSSADDLQSEMALMDLEDEELSRTIQGCQERLSEVDRDEASSRTQIQDLERTMAALGSEVEERRSELEQARMRINSVSLRRESSQRALETAESRRREIDERRDRVSLELEDAAARIGMHTREISSGREAVRDAAQLLEDRKAGLQSLRRKQDELRQDAETLSSKARELRSAIGSLRDEASITDIRIHELRTQMQNIAQRVSEEHGRDISQLDAEPAERGPFDREEAAERIASIRDKIQRLGEVNPGAVEEFEELNQRFEFLSSQKNDLEASMESLQKAIRKINRTSKERFLETFQEVNRNFSTMFPRLFDGGDAQMFLMDENDPLNTGVDIQVRLPGKRLKSMQLLSGGEKAMVSLTMILSIFLAKPSPVCILDEVDAPLDENNLDNFAGIVRELSERYQFMLITHNKLTMEAADVLYGITMREPGVSQVVSVRLKDVA
ncbi:MAG: chromosome segregation protein SMC, partial [bacterium]